MAQDKAKDDGGVTKKVAAAKKAIDDSYNSNVSGRRPRAQESPVAAATKEKPATEAKSSYEGLLHPQIGDSVHGIEERNKQAEGIESMHDGGKVKEDGPKNLKKGETVLPKDKDKSEKLAMEHLGKKAKGGVMSSAIDEVDDEKDEPKAEEKHETKKEEKAEGHKSEKKEDKPKVEKGKRVHVTVVHHHKAGHTMHHMREDGSHETHQFALGDHAGIGKNIADMLGAQSEEPAAAGAAPAAAGGPGGAPPEPAPAAPANL